MVGLPSNEQDTLYMASVVNILTFLVAFVSTLVLNDVMGPFRVPSWG